ncbi:alpha-hydroxy acid oxidase [Thauera mechernichensis]|uniref:Alpha-hydroxy acid oxidase n=1 Tax=Thauera mechernichensis TaxID=82788 RepID=A0ABW3W8E1_9RHOO|nr:MULTISPECIES: alpha-hydroxy acid oxidase [Thauera]MDG3064300.1 alpha-hydroxy acid oxidase [Thauera mechernichensis]
MSCRRRFHHGTNPARAQSIAELRAMAARRLPNFCLEYLEGGADDEITLSRNRKALDEVLWLPRTLVDVSQRELAVPLFGQDSALPMVIAPTGFNGLLADGGDRVLAEVAHAAGIPFCQSMVSTVALEDIVATGVRHWMQIYPFKDRDNVAAVVKRAELAGSEAIVLTTDASVFGNREWDRRNYRAPMKLNLCNLIDVARHPRWVWDVLVPRGMPRFRNLGNLPAGMDSARNAATWLAAQMDTSLTWDDVRWLRALWPRKLLVKGVLMPEDALRARDAGADGVVVSNHGGRQLDTVPAPIEMLAAVREAVGPDMTVIVDSGFRRGSDFVKARALGADAAMSGRATLYGLAAAGHGGAARAVEILRSEMARTLGLIGCAQMREVDGRYVGRG